MTTGEKIVEIRKSKNLSQENFAKMMSVSRQSVSKWESDICLPEIDKLVLICKTFNVQLNFLLKDNEDKVEVKESLNLLHELASGSNKVDKEIDVFSRKIIKQRKIAIIVISGLAIIMTCLLIICYSFSIQSDNKHQEFSKIDNDLMFERNDRVNELWFEINEYLESRKYQHGDYLVKVEYVDYEKELLTLTVTASANEYEKNTKITTQIVSNDGIFAKEVELVEICENVFQSKIEMPFCDELKIACSISTNNKQLSEIVFEDYNVKEKWKEIFNVKPKFFNDNNTKLSKFKINISKVHPEVKNNLNLENSSVTFKFHNAVLDEELVTGGFDCVRDYDYKTNQLQIFYPEINYLPKGGMGGTLEIYLDIGLNKPQKIIEIVSGDREFDDIEWFTVTYN